MNIFNKRITYYICTFVLIAVILVVAVCLDNNKSYNSPFNPTDETQTQTHSAEVNSDDDILKVEGLPGLHDENGAFISWASLKNDKVIDSDGDGIADLPAIYVNNGILTTNYNAGAKFNYSGDKLLGKLILDPEVVEVGEFALAYCEQLTEVELTDNVSKIGKRAFFVCRKLESINLNDNITAIGQYAFYSCIKLKKIYISSQMNTIEKSSFQYCTNAIGDIYIPDSISVIEENAFNGDKRLGTIYIPDNVLSIGKNAFTNVPGIFYDGDVTTGNYGENWGALARNVEGVVKMLSESELMAYVNSDATILSTVQWEGWKDFKDNNYLSGVINPELIQDEVYLSMKLPSENTNYASYRVNPEINTNKPEGKTVAVGIGAVYTVTGEELPDMLNICLGKFTVYVLYEGEDEEWQILDEHIPLTEKKYFQLRLLPWSDNSQTLAEKRVDQSKITYHDNYIEFNFTNQELHDNSVFHFYGEKVSCDASKVRGVVVVYDIWSNTPGIDGKLSCTVGLDQYEGSSNCAQAFWGKNYDMTNEVRTVIGHNIPDEVYEQLVKEGKSPEKCLENFLFTRENYR